MSNKHRRSATLATKVSSRPPASEVVAHAAKDVDPAKLAPDCKPADLVAWDPGKMKFTRLPLANAIPFDHDRAVSDQFPAIPETEIAHMDASVLATESKPLNGERLTPANNRRLAAAIELLREEFTRVAANQRWGKLTLEIPFEGGDAQDVVCQTTRRMRMN